MSASPPELDTAADNAGELENNAARRDRRFLAEPARDETSGLLESVDARAHARTDRSQALVIRA
jgi:hypothetical protein